MADVHRFASLDLERWCGEQETLLSLERTAELEAASRALASGNDASREAAGTCLRKLRVLDFTTGLFGRTMLTVGVPGGVRALPAHDIRVGDVAGVTVTGAGATGAGGAAGSSAALRGGADPRDVCDASGVVTQVTETALTIALDDSSGGASGGTSGKELETGDRVRVDKLADDITFKRLSKTLKELQAHVRESTPLPCARVLHLLFGEQRMVAGLVDEQPLFTECPVDSAAATDQERPSCVAPLAADLNDGQRAAIHAALHAQDVAMIHGPPGTGKTTTIVEYIRQEVLRGSRVLACAPSNVAVDNMLARLAAVPPIAGERGQGSRARPGSGLRLVRVGHPARVTPAGQALTLEALVAGAEGTAIVGDVQRELADVRARARKERDKAARGELRAEERRLKSEIRRRQEAVVADLLRGADVVLATTTGAGSNTLVKAMKTPSSAAVEGAAKRWHFDVVVIDEVAQAMELSCFIPLLCGAKLVIAGDHNQLPPTIISEDAASRGLRFTLADRVVQRFGDDARVSRPVVHMLTTQYRMNHVIMQWSSDALYDGRLVADASVAEHTLLDLPHVTAPADDIVTLPAAALHRLHSGAAAAARASLAAPTADSESSDAANTVLDDVTAHAVLASPPDPDADDIILESSCVTNPMVLVDTAGCDMPEVSDEGDSRANLGEADVAAKHVLALWRLGLRPQEIAVVTPYNAQVGLLRSMLSVAVPGVEVRSVDGFQGQEKEAIVISLVRSNPKHTVGFLADFRRLNVAVTRARRHVTVIADTETVKADPFIRGLVNYMESHGEVRSALEYMPASAVHLHSRPTPPQARAAPPSAPPARGTTKLRSAAAVTDTVWRQMRDFQTLLATGTMPAHGAIIKGSAKMPDAVMEIVPDVPNALDRVRLRLDSSLASDERRLVHELCETRGWNHESHGEASSRYITVWPRAMPVDVPAQQHDDVAAKLPERPASAASAVCANGDIAAGIRKMPPAPPAAPESTTAATAAAKNTGGGPAPMALLPRAPEMNSVLAQMHTRRMAAAAATSASSPPPAAFAPSILAGAPAVKAKDAKSGGAAAAKPKREGPTPTAAKPAAARAASGTKPLPDIDDEMALLEALVAESGKCAAKGCGRSTQTTGNVCKHCRQRFCYSHAVPEDHGCGDAASAAARAAWLDSHAAPPSRLPSGKREILAHELQKSLSAAEAARAPKATGKAKKK